VIDLDKKQIFKGSEIMPVEALITPVSKEEHKRIVNDILSSFFSGNNLLYSDLQTMLSRNGYSIKKDTISIKGDNNELLKIPNALYKKIRYNDRLKQANQFTVMHMNEAIALSKIFFVKAGDIVLNPNAARDDTDLRDTVKFFANNRDALRDWLNAHNMALVKHHNNTYIIDARKRTIADVSGLGLDFAFNLDNYSENYGNSYDNIQENFASGMLVGLFAAISGMLGSIGGEEQEDIDLNRKKKKKRQMML
jgi:hypothetical protein